MDKLETVFDLQKKFNARVGLDHPIVLLEEKEEWLRRLCVALSQETAELMDCTRWKWWKKSEFDLQNAKVEVVDLLHFVVSMALVLGMSADDLMDAYRKKNEVNFKRQDVGYSSQTKDPEDCRHI